MFQIVVGLEVLGSGIVDPNVFRFVGYKDVSGYAFGLRLKICNAFTSSSQFKYVWGRLDFRQFRW